MKEIDSSLPPSSAVDEISAEGQARLEKLREEIDELHEKVTKERAKYQASTMTETAVSAMPQVRLKIKRNVAVILVPSSLSKTSLF